MMDAQAATGGLAVDPSPVEPSDAPAFRVSVDPAVQQPRVTVDASAVAGVTQEVTAQGGDVGGAAVPAAVERLGKVVEGNGQDEPPKPKPPVKDTAPVNAQVSQQAAASIAPPSQTPPSPPPAPRVDGDPQAKSSAPATTPSPVKPQPVADTQPVKVNPKSTSAPETAADNEPTIGWMEWFEANKAPVAAVGVGVAVAVVVLVVYQRSTSK